MHYVDALEQKIADKIDYGSATIDELRERLEAAEQTIADWAPFINQLRTTLAVVAMNPMISAMMNPAQRQMLSQFLPPEG